MDYLAEHIAEKGYAPSIREMCERFGLSAPSAMQRRLERLEQHGWIERVGARAIRINNA